MTMLQHGMVGAGGVDTGDIEHSLRFRSSASAYLSRTPSVAGNRKTWTWSGWVKRGAISSATPIFEAGTTLADRFCLRIASSDTLEAFSYRSSVFDFHKYTNAVFRDVSSFAHFVVVLDTDNSTADDRVRLYVNGNRITSFSISINPSLGYASTLVNATTPHNLAYDQGNPAYLDGYLSRVCFVDGQALAPDSFGYLNTQTNEWITKTQAQVKEVVDAGGINSFMLDFDNGTSTTTLSYDKSSKGNNWTCNNISLTAGSTYDWMEDVPGNSYAVFNPLDKSGIPSGYSLTWSEANCKASVVGGPTLGLATNASILVNNGKYYFEVTPFTSGTSTYANNIQVMVYRTSTDMVGYRTDGQKVVDNTPSSYGSSYVTGDVIGCAVDIDSGSITFYKNGVSQGSISKAFAGDYFIRCHMIQDNLSGTFLSSWQINFGQRPFAYTPPTGFLPLCQRNLPEPSIVDPQQHFDVVLDTGANIKTTAEALFTDQLAWIKDRGNSNNHQLIDSVRGTSAVLQSNTAAAETTYSAPSGSSVGWTWKANGTGVSNTDGSITSTVSANTEAGFSIVTYTGNGVNNATVGHGLPIAPKLVIVKNRTSSSGAWVARAEVIPANLYLNLTNANISLATTSSGGVSAVTASTFECRTGSIDIRNTNFLNDTYVAYCFAEIEGYSKIGSYTGNGSADGPFVWTGHKPAFILIKRTDTTSNWTLVDMERAGRNVDNDPLYPNLSNAEGTTDLVDIVSNGFKLRTTDASVNASGGTYIFIAFADAPFKYSNSR